MTAKPFAAPVLGSELGGGVEVADPQRTQRAIDAALASNLPDHTTASGNTLRIERGAEHEVLNVKVEVASESAPFAPVANATFDGRDHAVIRVLPTATEAQVQRAVAGKLAELAYMANERAAGTRTETSSALVEGSQATKLSPRDYNSIAQLKTALHQIETARASGDTAGAEQMRRDAYALAVGMGLVEAEPAQPVHLGPEGAANPDRPVGAAASERRLALMDQVLGPDAPKIRELVAGARADAPAIADIRTQRAAARERLQAYCKELIAQRALADAELKTKIDALAIDGKGQLFDRLIVGGGWAATADYATMKHGDGGAGIPSVMAISHGGDPWAGRGDLLMGQNPAELEVAGFSVQPSDSRRRPAPVHAVERLLDRGRRQRGGRGHADLRRERDQARASPRDRRRRLAGRRAVQGDRERPHVLREDDRRRVGARSRAHAERRGPRRRSVGLHARHAHRPVPASHARRQGRVHAGRRERCAGGRPHALEGGCRQDSTTFVD